MADRTVCDNCPWRSTNPWGYSPQEAREVISEAKSGRRPFCHMQTSGIPVRVIYGPPCQGAPEPEVLATMTPEQAFDITNTDGPTWKEVVQ